MGDVVNLRKKGSDVRDVKVLPINRDGINWLVLVEDKRVDKSMSNGQFPLDKQLLISAVNLWNRYFPKDRIV